MCSSGEDMPCGRLQRADFGDDEANANATLLPEKYPKGGGGIEKVG